MIATLLLASCVEPERVEESPSAAAKAQPAEASLTRSGISVPPTRICPAAPPLAKGQDDLRFTEYDFTRERYEAGIRFFASELHELLGLRPDSAKDWTEREGFWVTYTNNQQFIEGFVLRQAAEIERLRSPMDSTFAADSLSAAGRFCRFVSTRQWRD